ncbi:2221_t:CDS:10 [Diversispora eburnea]|uniref:2221_t:CDS:1 n=1 Tax=Diversispora eburnea TaxID=1213867 RepID=A0A9N9C2X7_9GLOM|nr:2221_t:CDS:10 [Diversispora eburnea]
MKKNILKLYWKLTHTGDKAKLTIFDSENCLDYSSSSSGNNKNDNQKHSNFSNINTELSSHSCSSSTITSISSSISSWRNEDKRKSSDYVNKSSSNTLPPSFNTFNRNSMGHQRKVSHNIDLIGEMINSFNSNSPGRRSSFSSTNSDASISSNTIINSNTVGGSYELSTRRIFYDDCSESSDDESFRNVPSSYISPSPSSILSAASASTSLSSSYSYSTSPRNTFNTRRIRRFSQTSMENGIFNPTPLPGTSNYNMNNYSYDNNNHNNNVNVNNISIKLPARSLMYSVGVVISLEDNQLLEEFIFSHFALLENKLHQLQSYAFRILSHLLKKSSSPSSINGPNSIFCQPSRQKISISPLVALMIQHEPLWLEAVKRFKNSIYQLYSTPRIQEPLWLNISTFPQKRNLLAKCLLDELSYLLEKFDEKRTNYVLMHHLSWVPTVAPTADFEEGIRKNLFYDPLWAQLGDLYGSIGTPSTMSRTIIVGNDDAKNAVRRILFVLSYFIRCNEVYENVENMIPLDGQNSLMKESNIEKTKENGENIKNSENSNKIEGRNHANHSENGKTSDQLFAKSYGRSLMVGCCDTYMSDFVLMGLPKYDFQESLEADLKESLKMQPFSLQDPVSRSVCILGQINSSNCSVSVLGYDAYGNNNGKNSPASIQGDHIRNGDGYVIPLQTSNYIFNMLHQCIELYTKMGLPAESCIEYMEDQLRILYYKAVMHKKLLNTTIATTTTNPTSGVGSISISSPLMFSKVADDIVPINILETLSLQQSDLQLIHAINFVQ